MTRTYLKNGSIVTESTIFQGGIVIEDEKIQQLVAGSLEIPGIENVLDIEGKFILPGLVDSHVHFEDPGKTEWEEFNTGGMAAAAGGVTTIMDMPVDSEPPTTTLENFNTKLKAISSKAITDFALWGGLVDNNLKELEALHQAGVIGFKAFMEETGVDTFKAADDGIVYEGLKKAKELGNLVAVHAENDKIVGVLREKLIAAGRTDRRAWLESRPVESEVEAVIRAIYWAKLTGGWLHVVHATNAGSVEAIQRARCEGVNVTVDTGPNYLFFDEDDFLKVGPLLKMGPPIRSRKEVEKLWDCVLSGKVDVFGSDHSPSTWKEKEPGMDNVWEGWGGIGGIQTMLPALLTEGYHKRGLDLRLLVKMTSANPARLFGVFPQKGCLMPGSDADLVIVDLEKKWTFQKEQIFNKNPESPYIGYEYQGKVEKTMLRGKFIYDAGKILVNPGYGKFLKPNRIH